MRNSISKIFSPDLVSPKDHSKATESVSTRKSARRKKGDLFKFTNLGTVLFELRAKLTFVVRSFYLPFVVSAFANLVTVAGL